MFYFWLIPVLLALFAILWLAFKGVKQHGGSGERSDGRTISDE